MLDTPHHIADQLSIWLIAGFVDFVSSAHSWYKHLPLVPPGIPFHFFLNPHVACDMDRLPTRRIAYRKRLKRGFHYSEWPTSEYLKKCGYLDYRCLEGEGMIVKPIQGARRRPPGDSTRRTRLFLRKPSAASRDSGKWYRSARDMSGNLAAYLAARSEATAGGLCRDSCASRGVEQREILVTRNNTPR